MRRLDAALILDRARSVTKRRQAAALQGGVQNRQAIITKCALNRFSPISSSARYRCCCWLRSTTGMGRRTVDSTVSAIAQNDLNAFSGSVDELLDENQKSMLQLAISPETRWIIPRMSAPLGHATPLEPLETLQSLPKLGKSFRSLTLFNGIKKPLWTQINRGEWVPDPGFTNQHGPQPDERVWSQQGNVCFEQANTSSGTLQYSVPIHDEKGTGVVGAAVAVLDLASVFSDASRGLQTKSSQRSMVVVLDRSGNTVSHSDRSLERLPINQALPGFDSISSAMIANQSGVDQYHSPSGPATRSLMHRCRD